MADTDEAEISSLLNDLPDLDFGEWCNEGLLDIAARTHCTEAGDLKVSHEGQLSEAGVLSTASRDDTEVYRRQPLQESNHPLAQQDSFGQTEKRQKENRPPLKIRGVLLDKGMGTQSTSKVLSGKPASVCALTPVGKANPQKSRSASLEDLPDWLREKMENIKELPHFKPVSSFESSYTPNLNYPTADLRQQSYQQVAKVSQPLASLASYPEQALQQKPSWSSSYQADESLGLQLPRFLHEATVPQQNCQQQPDQFGRGPPHARARPAVHGIQQDNMASPAVCPARTVSGAALNWQGSNDLPPQENACQPVIEFSPVVHCGKTTERQALAELPIGCIPSEAGQTVFCSQKGRSDGQPAGLTIHWAFTQAYAQLTDVERRGPEYSRLKEEAAKLGLTPVTLNSMPLSLANTVRPKSRISSQPYSETRGMSATVRLHGAHESPSKQESVSGQNSGVPKAGVCENVGRVMESRSDAAQESVVGNASSKRKSVPDRSKKLILQLTPLDNALRNTMLSCGLNPGLELICRAKKELNQVLSHLQRKWKDASPGALWPGGQYALRLYPTQAMPVLAGASWGHPTLPESLTINDLHIAMGGLEALPLHYGWHLVEDRAGEMPHKTPKEVPLHLRTPLGWNSNSKTPMSRPLEAADASPDLIEQDVKAHGVRAQTSLLEPGCRMCSAARKLATDTAADCVGPSSNPRTAQVPEPNLHKARSMPNMGRGEPLMTASYQANGSQTVTVPEQSRRTGWHELDKKTHRCAQPQSDFSQSAAYEKAQLPLAEKGIDENTSYLFCGQLSKGRLTTAGSLPSLPSEDTTQRLADQCCTADVSVSATHLLSNQEIGVSRNAHGCSSHCLCPPNMGSGGRDITQNQSEEGPGCISTSDKVSPQSRMQLMELGQAHGRTLLDAFEFGSGSAIGESSQGQIPAQGYSSDPEKKQPHASSSVCNKTGKAEDAAGPESHYRHCYQFSFGPSLHCGKAQSSQQGILNANSHAVLDTAWHGDRTPVGIQTQERCQSCQVNPTSGCAPAGPKPSKIPPRADRGQTPLIAIHQKPSAGKARSAEQHCYQSCAAHSALQTPQPELMPHQTAQSIASGQAKSVMTNTSRPTSRSWLKSEAKSVSLSLEASLRLREANSKPNGRGKAHKSANEGDAAAKPGASPKSLPKKRATKKQLLPTLEQDCDKGSDLAKEDLQNLQQRGGGPPQIAAKKGKGTGKKRGPYKKKNKELAKGIMAPALQGEPMTTEIEHTKGEALDAELIVAFETEVETGKDACSRETTAGAVLNGIESSQIVSGHNRQVLRAANGRKSAVIKRKGRSAMGELPKRGKTRHCENLDPLEQPWAQGPVMQAGAATPNMLGNLTPANRDCSTPLKRSPRSVNLKVCNMLQEDRTCDGFEAWAAMSKQKQANAATGRNITDGEANQGKDSLVPDEGLPKFKNDASLTPWVEQREECKPLDSVGDTANANPEADPAVPGLEPDPFDGCLVPDDLASDFEAFLNDADLLNGCKFANEPIAGKNLFSEMFAA